jgi:hypothetical protein
MEDRFQFRVWCNRFKRYVPPHKVRINPKTGEVHGVHSNGNVSEWQLEQCTGLKDKNGKLIFEGDVCVYDDGDGWEIGKGVVVFKDFFAFEHDGLMYPCIDGRITRVIGNIHDNQELLETLDGRMWCKSSI